MKKYDSYKDSGIEWIGEIPSHWNIYKVKNLIDKSLYYQVGDGDHGSIKPEMYQEFGIPYIRVQNLSWSGKLILENVVFISEEIQSLNPKSKLLPNDILIAKTGATVGKLGLITDDIAEANTTSSVGKLTVDKNRFFPKYILYSFQADFFQKELWLKATEKSAQPGFNIDDFVLFKIASPQLSEQTTIANYLDQKTTQIDDLIAKKERLIQLLEEERTAIINQAVTKGLDPTVPMKDSGIEWLGEIPAHWEVAKFNLYVSIRHGHQFMNHDFTDDGVKVVKITQLHKNGYLDLSKCSYVSSEQLENYQSILIKEQDILMCLTGGTIGKIIRVGEVNEPLLQNYRVGHFSSGNVSKISDDFIFWLMSSESIVSQIFFQMRETGQPNIGMDDFGRMRITIPPLMEQEKIVKHIVNKTAEISEILIKSKQEIELLKEYKTALISEVVTGKVDVRNEKLS